MVCIGYGVDEFTRCCTQGRWTFLIWLAVYVHNQSSIFKAQLRQMADAVSSLPSKELLAKRPAAAWKLAVAKVQAQQSDAPDSDVTDGFVGDKLNNVPSVIQRRSLATPAAAPAVAPPRLAVMIHAARNLPGTASSGSGNFARMYAKAAVHMPGQLPLLANKQKTHLARKLEGSVVWNSLLSLCPEAPEAMVLTITLKQKQQFTNSTVVWGTVSVPLSKVVASPAEWGQTRQLQLQGHKVGAAGATLEVQLFLSTERIQGPLSVLAATWNVGNALPPPPEQLQEWLRGTDQSVHQLVAVGAQECNYTKDARAAGRTMSRRTSGKGKTYNSVAVAAAAEAAVAAVAETPADSDSANALPTLAQHASCMEACSSSTADVAGSSTAARNHTLDSKRNKTSNGPSQVDLDMEVLNGADLRVNLQGQVGEGTADVQRAAEQQQKHHYHHHQQQQQQQQREVYSSSGGGSEAAAAAAEAAAAAAGMPAAVEEGGEALGDVWQAAAGNSRTAKLKQYFLEQVDSANAWERHVAAALGPKYWLVGSKHMFQTRLLIFARVDVVPYISHIAGAYEATGIGHVGLNKGGVALSLKLDDTHIAFVSSHLAAHQSKAAQRNSDVSEICANIQLESPGQRPAAAGACLATGFHHVVWMGDLNYRLDYGEQATTLADSPTPEDFASLCARITSGEYRQLLRLDQLRKEQAAGRVFAGFAEGEIDFAPTFKVVKGEPGFHYIPKRSPAWCDRVLFKSALPHKQGSCQSYFTAPDICTSDHKPVGAVLSLPLVTNTVTSGRSATRTLFKLYVASVNLNGQSTWERIAEIAVKTGTPAEARSSGGFQWQPTARKLRIVLSGACLAGVRQKHSLKVNQDAFAAGVGAVGAVLPTPNTAALEASLSQREENMPLLPGAVQDLQDDWLLLQLVLLEGLGLGLKKRTIARGIVPLHAAVQEYNARTFKAVQVPVQLECNGSAAGTAMISLQLISSQTARQGMYEAIRRMRMLAMHRSAGHSATEVRRGASALQDASDERVASRTMSGTLLRFSNKVKEGIGMVRRMNS